MPTNKCRDCSEPIRWRELPSGKWIPIDPDGSIHFASCVARQKPALPEDRCHVCGSPNVERGPGAGIHYARLRCLDCSTFRWLPHPKTEAVQ